MIKRSVLIFILIVSALVGIAVKFLQTPEFAQFVRKSVSGHIPAHPGIDWAFSELKIKFIPPGVSIVNPKVVINQSPLLPQLHKGLSLNAKQIDVFFVPFQAFSGTIHIQSVGIIDGTITSESSDPVTIEQLRIQGIDISLPGPSRNLKLFFQKFFVKTPGMQLDAELLRQEERIEALVHFEGYLQNLAQWNLVQESTGKIWVDGRLNFSPDRWQDKLNYAAKVRGKELRIYGWETDLFSAEFSGQFSDGASKIEVHEIVMDSQEIPRSGGFQPGSGGKIHAGPVSASFQWKESKLKIDPILIPLSFENVHLHWLLGPLVKKVYALDFRMSGKQQIEFIPESATRNWELRAKLNQTIDRFRLDNQRFHQTKPPHAVFDFSKIRLEGQVVVNNEEVQIPNATIRLPRTLLKSTGGFHFTRGANLKSSGTINLEDLGQISENDIRGEGEVQVTTHGPFSKLLVDIDANIKDASYLKLKLGSLLGRMTWDDDLDQFLFKKDLIKHNHTEYTVDGLLSLAKENMINLEVKIPHGYSEDIINTFWYLLKDKTWFPHSLKGPTSGSIQVSGGISLDTLKVVGNLKGAGWDVANEQIQSATLNGGYDSGKYFIDSFEVQKKSGHYSGMVSVSANNWITWDVSSHNVLLSDFDYLARLDVPFRGRVHFQSSGSGLLGKTQSSTDLELNQATVREIPYPPSHVMISTKNGGVQIAGSIFGRQAVLDASYNEDNRSSNFIQGELRQFDFSPLLMLLNKKAMDDPALLASASGVFDLQYKAGFADQLNGKILFSDFRIERTGSLFTLSRPVETIFKGGNFNLNSLEILGESSKATLNLSNSASSLKGSISGSLDNSFFLFLTPALSFVEGTSDLSYEISGTLTAPVINGFAKIQSPKMKLESFDSAFEKITGTLAYRNQKFLAQNFRSDLGGGTVNLHGEISLSTTDSPKIDLTAVLSGTRLKIFPFQMAKVNGSLNISGTEKPYLVEGFASILSGISKEKIMSQSKSQGTTAYQHLYPTSTTSSSINTPVFKLNIQVDTPNPVIVQNDLFRNLKAKGKLTVINTIDAPRVVGKIDAVEGQLVFKNRVFQIQSGTVVLSNPTSMDPVFELIGNTEVNGIKVQMYAKGKKDEIKIDMTSSPTMSEADIFSLLAIGLTPADAKKINGSDLSMVQAGEVASLILHQTEFNKDFEEKTGIELGVDSTINSQQGQSAFRNQSQADTTAAPQVTLKKKFSDQLSLSIGSTIGIGSNRSNQFSLDYLISPGIAASINAKSFGNQGTVNAPDVQSGQNNIGYGVELKYQKRFK